MVGNIIYVNWENRTILGGEGAINWVEEEIATHMNGDSDCLEEFLSSKALSAVDVWLLTDDEKEALTADLEETAREWATDDFEMEFDAVCLDDID